jgi:hypothetical protein
MATLRINGTPYTVDVDIEAPVRLAELAAGVSREQKERGFIRLLSG